MRRDPEPIHTARRWAVLVLVASPCILVVSVAVFSLGEPWSTRMLAPIVGAGVALGAAVVHWRRSS